MNDNNIEGANYILLNITSGNNEVMMDEISQITDYIQDEAGLSADIIWGTGRDEELGDNISITLIATGFEANKSIGGIQTEKKKEKVIHDLKIDENADSKGQEVKNTLQEQSIPLEPELKTFDAPKVEQIKMELDVPVVEKTVDFQNHDAISLEASEEASMDVTESPKIVHNLYEDIDANNDSREESDGQVISEENKFSFASSEEESKEDSSFEPSFNEISPSSNPTFTESTPIQHEEKFTFADELDAEERLKRSQQRLSQLNNLTSKLKSPSSISDLEDEPAYIRKKVRLDNIEHSSANKESRFTLGDDGDNNPEIRPNNSFLHDNVD